MALLTILRYPDPRLTKVASPVKVIDERVQTLIDDMLQTMYAAKGIGLAATQVDVHERLIVLDISEEKNQPTVLINPELIECSRESKVDKEGCLSVPGIYDLVSRHSQIRVRALNRQGVVQEFDAEGLLAVCIQHEMDHLMGKVFVSYLSPLKRNRIRSKLVKNQRQED